MLPSLLARHIQQGLKQFLVAGFEPADAFMHGLMRRFVEEQSAWLKAWSVKRIDARTTTLVDQVMRLFGLTEEKPCCNT